MYLNLVIYRPRQEVIVVVGRVRGERSDVKESYPGGADMEAIIKELGLYDDITTGIQRDNINSVIIRFEQKNR